TLILTGNNTHEGGTTVSRGTLQIGKINDDGSGGGSGWVAGDIATSSGTHVRFNRAEDLAFNGNITGTGTTTVASGGIYLGEGFSIGGPLFVNSGATFGGSGTVHGPVTVSKNATLAPGGIFSGVGTLTVNNGVSFETNSTYEYNINNGDDTHDLLVVSNSSAEVRIADGAKLAVYGRGTFGDDNDLQVIAANRGQFRDGDGFLDDSVRFDLSGDWGWRFEQVMKNDGLFLSWKGFEKSIGRFGSDNAIRAANGVDRIGPSFGLFDELDGITTAKSMANAFGQLHGEVYASNKIAAAQLQRSFQGLMPNGREYYQGDMPKVWNRWGTLTGGTRNRSSIGTYSAYDLSSTGVTAGIDRIVTRKVLLGGAIGYDYGDQYYKDIRSKEQMDAFRTMVYGSWFNGKYYVDAYGGYTKNYHRTKRSIDIGEFSAVARGKYNDDMASIGGEFGRVYNFREFTLTPSIGLQYLTIAHTPSFSETGGASGDYSANLRVEQSGYDSFRLPIGVKASKLFVGSRNIAWTPEARVSYNYEMMDTSARVWTRFKGHDDVRFAAESGDWGRSSVRVGAGLGAIVSNRFNFRVDYDFESYKHATVHAFEALLGFQW
ncbi:MAG: autotransporter domain-containing protein, partial [Planctomycetaceae bacterium]|nr:autotransporter domain-containing protein [Planctomycetaceae bacterium]